MFFSKEKKSSNSRVLTEAEIKKRLYGDFETHSAGVSASSHEIKMSGSTFESKLSAKSDVSSAAVSPRSQSFGAASKPELLVARSTSSATFSNKESRVSLGSGDWKVTALRVFQSILGFLTGLLWKVGSYLVQALEFILKLLDPRKPQARKVLYSITACVLVFALFLGVFRLNAQRKKAMSGERVASTSVAAPNQDSAKKIASAATPLSSVAPAQVQKEESQEMILKALENSKASVAPSMTSTSPAAAQGKYVIQVATYAVADDANRVVQTFIQAGFEAFFKKQIRNSTGHSFYPIYLGRFKTSSEAQQTLAQFRKSNVSRPFQDSFVRTLE